MITNVQREIGRLNGHDRELAQLISDISMRIFNNDWNCDIEWDVRNAMDNGSFTISGVDSRLDANQGRLSDEEIRELKRLRAQLQDGWVHLDGLVLKRYGALPLGSLRTVTAQEWRDTIGTDDYRLARYKVID